MAEIEVVACPPGELAELLAEADEAAMEDRQLELETLIVELR